MQDSHLITQETPTQGATGQKVAGCGGGYSRPHSRGIANLAAEEGPAAETLMNVVALIRKRLRPTFCSAYLLEPDAQIWCWQQPWASPGVHRQTAYGHPRRPRRTSGGQMSPVAAEHCAQPPALPSISTKPVRTPTSPSSEFLSSTAASCKAFS